jgi:hypothetical protein
VAKVEDLDPTSSRAVAEYLTVLDDAAFGGASPSGPKAISPSIRRPATPLRPTQPPSMPIPTTTSSISNML